MPPRQSVVHDEKSPYETWSAYDKRRGVPHRAQRPSESFSDYDKRRKAEMATTKRIRPGVSIVGNFEPKRVRKAKRKVLVRGYVGNKIADVKLEMSDRAEFYRNLRLMKVARRKIAREMQVLADRLRALKTEVARVEDRIPGVNLRLVDETRDMLHDAVKAATVAADEWHTFSRQRIYYIKELAA